MALDNEYFDAINIDVVKKKYYNANKVEAVLSDIRSQVEALNAENSELRSRIDEMSGNKEAIGDVLLSVKKISSQMLSDAQEQADSILTEAQKKADSIMAEAQAEAKQARSEAQSHLEQSIVRMEECYYNMKQHHLECVEALDKEWQDFLCTLYPDEEPELEIPDDIASKVDAIAKELFEIG